ncbi:MAG: NAD(P)/FAD-dependent oxidoreductase [Candidatus Kerfeldbacteria bacterium]|nr:NAD(P)/FAD-dependent oxidoreductase [Candidatus Kerfeldbacteria bacterium]
MNIAIIGGGAAGMMAAATIAESGTKHNLVLFDKNAKIGVKVAISGGGRCNVTSGIEDVRTLLTKYPRGAKFLQNALYAFGPSQIRAYFEEHGVPLKREVDMRVFPVSDIGQDIVDVFVRLFREHQVDVHFKEGVVGIEKSEKGYVVKTKLASYQCDAVVLALGGQAYRHTGSTGDGYSLAEKLGHTITPLAPSLNAFLLSEEWVRDISGVSLQRITISVADNKKIFATGPIVFTHRGISGPAVFALSSQVAFTHYTKEQPLALSIDAAPELSQEQIIQRLKTYGEAHPKQQFKNALHLFLPQSCVDAIGGANQLPLQTMCAQVSKQQLMHAAHFLKHMTVHAIGRSAGEEFVTAGGVRLSEVDPKTGESKISPRLYFAGEILDVDGYTGGFNLTASWAMGRAVGRALSEQS